MLNPPQQGSPGSNALPSPQWSRTPRSLGPCLGLLTVILMRWGLEAVWSCISMMSHDFEYFLKRLLRCVFLLLKILCSDQSPIFDYVVFLMFWFFSSLCLLDTGPLTDVKVTKIFSHSLGFVFTGGTISLAVWSFLVSWVPFVNCWSCFLSYWSSILEAFAWACLPKHNPCFLL